MFGTAMALSWMPLATAVGAPGSNPLIFHFGLTIGILVPLCGYLAIRYRKLATPFFEAVRTSWSTPSRRRFILSMGVFGTITNFDYAVFASAISHVDAAVAAVLIETWPVWFILGMTLCDRAGVAAGFPKAGQLLSFRNRHDRRYQPFDHTKTLAVAAAVVGGAVVVWSASKQGGGESTGAWGVLLGCVIAVGAAVTTSLSWAHITLGTAVASEAQLPCDRPVSEKNVNEAFVMAVTVLTTAMGLPIGIGAGVATGWDMTGRGWAVSLIAGLVLLPAATICFRQANLGSPDLAVNALNTTAPMMALTWLAIFTDVHIAQPVLFAFGTALILAGGTAVQWQSPHRIRSQL